MALPLQTQVVQFDIASRTHKEIAMGDINLASDHPQLLYWIHCDLSQPDSLHALHQKLHFPDELIQFFNEDEMVPKVVDQGETLTLRIQCLVSWETRGRHVAKFSSLIIHLTSRYCLTIATDPIPALMSFIQVYPKSVKYAKTPCFILFLLLDNVINDYSSILFDFEEASERMESRIRSSRRNYFNDVMQTKKQVMRVKRYAVSLRDMLMRISGRKIAVISDQCRQSLSALYDHAQTIVSEAEAIREIFNGMLDQIDNALMHSLNESMRVLTAFAAILLPLTLIAGIYGMNFHYMPELYWRYGYYYALALMIFVTVFLLWLFKRKKWF